MAIWYENFSLDHVIKLRNNNLNKHLGIEFQKIGDDYISAKMPVDEKTMQSRGVLHGGASCVLAESLGSIASNLCIDMRRQKAVGLEIDLQSWAKLPNELPLNGTLLLVDEAHFAQSMKSMKRLVKKSLKK